MTGTTATKPYESLPQPNEANPIAIDTFSWWSIQVARIKRFNGEKNDTLNMAVYSHLLSWKKTTGEVRPSQPYIADCTAMSVDAVQTRVKILVKMGWITATPVRKPGSKEISHTIYTVKEPEKIMKELNAALATQGDAAVKVVKNQKQQTEESKSNDKSKEQQPVAVEPSALGNDEQHSIRQPADHRGHNVSPDDEINEEDDPTFPPDKSQRTPALSNVVKTGPTKEQMKIWANEEAKMVAIGNSPF